MVKLNGRPSGTPSIIHATRHTWTFAQGIVGLFATGSLLYGFHSWFLFENANEYFKLQWEFGNRCASESLIVGNPDSLLPDDCTGLATYTPEFQLYENHWPIVAALALAMLTVLLIAALLWKLSHRRPAPPDPTGQEPHGSAGDGLTI